MEPVITEVRIYADKNGNICIPSEYRSDVTYGTNIKALAVSLYSEGVMSNDRIASFLNAASKGELELSEGSIYGFCRKFAKTCEKSISNLENRLLNSDVVATDATTVTVNGELNYIRNFSTKDAVVYHAMKSKSIEALQKLDFLKYYAGTLLHDHETALYHFGTDHAECNVHIIRYLRKNTEETGNVWSDGMISLLCEMNRLRKEYIAQGNCRFSDEMLADYEARYFSLLKKVMKKIKQQSTGMRKKMSWRCLTGWKSTAITIFYFCMIFLYLLMIIFQNVICEKPRTDRKWQEDSEKIVVMKCTVPL